MDDLYNRSQKLKDEKEVEALKAQFDKLDKATKKMETELQNGY